MGPDTILAKLYSAPFLSNPSSWLEPLSKLWIGCQEQVQVVGGRVGPAHHRERTGYPVKRLPCGVRVLYKRVLYKQDAYQENFNFETGSGNQRPPRVVRDPADQVPFLRFGARAPRSCSRDWCVVCRLKHARNAIRFVYTRWQWFSPPRGNTVTLCNYGLKILWGRSPGTGMKPSEQDHLFIRINGVLIAWIDR